MKKRTILVEVDLDGWNNTNHIGDLIIKLKQLYPEAIAIRVGLDLYKVKEDERGMP